MCTILLELKRHEKTIVHARIALKLLLMELFGDFDQLQQQQQQQDQQQLEQQGGPEHEHEALALGQSSSQSSSGVATMAALCARLPPDRVAVLAIAYHNYACQQEFLRKYHDSLVSYEKATKVVTTHLGADHPLVASLTEPYQAAQPKMEAKVKRHQEKAAATAASSVSASSAHKPSRLDQHNAKSAKSLHAEVQRMPIAPHQDGPYEGDQVDPEGFTSDA